MIILLQAMNIVNKTLNNKLNSKINIKEDSNITCVENKDLNISNKKFIENSKEKINLIENNKHLSSDKDNLKNMRITVKTILFVIGIPKELKNLSSTELSSEKYFGQYGRIVKLTVNDKPYNKSSNNGCVYSIHINYQTERECSLAMLALHDKILNNNKIKASFGTTKYCKNFVEDKPCYNNECLYYHKIDKLNEMHKVKIY